MKSILSLIILLISISNLSAQQKNVKHHFKKYKENGSIVIYNQNKDSFFYYDSARCSQQFIPASTFKIFNSLVAFETGVIPDTSFIMKWDGVKRNYDSWNQDLNIAKAFKYSAVWFYQEIARQVGEEKMQYYIDKNHYGNQNIQGGIDMFWLDGELRISQLEQIDLLRKLYHNELEFSNKNQDLVKAIMLNEKNDKYALYAKTGWSVINQMNYGWFVGWVERDGNVYYFATNISAKNADKDFGADRKNITFEVLKDFKIID
ncbi:class D beta-lactamase [Chondrinema litorale]|uniref:class D beta-lactamase n=1 Tax=Chondrinema litorale TaxID=2994555 RepID=UPI002543F4AE|nr:class D beta-lactamase [Chondrinema litorale]UZR98602.1 class D beta-lactamase [Chondrinema litorale]